jgi:hypothetical protein
MAVIFNITAVFIVKVIIGLLFLISGFLKLPDLKGFFVIFVQYGILKGTLARIAAYSFPFVEIIVGIALLTSNYEFFFSGIAFLMLLVSTLGIIFVLYSKKKIDNCGCFGTSIKSPLDKKKLIENILWSLIALYLFLSFII